MSAFYHCSVWLTQWDWVNETVLSFLTVYSDLYKWDIPGAMGHPVGGLPGDSGLDNYCLHLLVGGVYGGSYRRTHDNTLWEVIYDAAICKCISAWIKKITNWDLDCNMGRVNDQPIDMHIYEWVKRLFIYFPLSHVCILFDPGLRYSEKHMCISHACILLILLWLWRIRLILFSYCDQIPWQPTMWQFVSILNDFLALSLALSPNLIQSYWRCTYLKRCLIF